MRKSKPKALDYSKMSRADAVQHFSARLREIKSEILTWPLPERVRFLADCLEGGDAVARDVKLGLARHILSELEAGRG